MNRSSLSKPCRELSLGIFFLVFCCLSSAPGLSEAAPTLFPTGLTINQPDKIYQGYTLYFSPYAEKICVVDPSGNEVHSWKSPRIGHTLGKLAKPLPGGRILTFLNWDGPGNKMVEMDWEGNVVWEFYDPSFSIHHDFQRLPNGNTLILGAKYIYAPNITPHEIKDDVIIEVDPSCNVIWQWSTADHYDQLRLSSESRQIIYSGRLDNIFHTNSIQSMGANEYSMLNSAFKPENILVSQRNTNLIFIVNKLTGNIAWRMKGIATIGQHHARLIPSDLPGGGNIILFDNGGRAGFPIKQRLFSRVIEMNPGSGLQTWIYDTSFGYLFSRSFFSAYMGSAQRLPNGNTLITESQWGRIFELTAGGEIVWEYISPYDATTEGDISQVYRAYRMELSWPNGVCCLNEPFPW